MNWIDSFVSAIDYIENHLTDELLIDDIAKSVAISPYYFQKVFTVYCGYNVSEYIRSRRLYQAALDLRSSNMSVIDVALKYGYETPESFTKAFSRFHGISPSKAKDRTEQIKIFLPLKIKISISGGKEMDFKIEKENCLKFIGFMKEIKADKGYIECPKFWDEFNEKYWANIDDGSAVSKAILANNICEYAICYDGDGKSFKYMICGKYNGGNVPAGMIVKEFDEVTWAKFNCVGPMPGALQSVNTMIWNEWIPNHPKYEMALNADIEWYSNGDVSSNDYKSAIWIPIKEK